MFKATKDFLGKPAPPNYVAGLGRGATGFTTRSDIGPAREPTMGDEKPGFGRGADTKGKEDDGKDDDEGNLYNDDEAGLFAGMEYDKDDEEADEIYDSIDDKMDERRKKWREAREKEELAKYRAERPKIQQQFADLKRGLADVSTEEWKQIPEIGDLRKKKSIDKSRQRYMPVPDMIIERANTATDFVGTLDARTQAGLETPLNGLATPMTDFKQIGEAREKVLKLMIDKVSDSVSGQTTVDPKGYLTDLNSIQVRSAAEIGDYKKAKLLLKSVTTTNPKHAPGWIAAARVEETVGKLVSAREIIAKGCEECPKSEDIWMEAARLNTPENAKVILANAVRHVPQSVRIWLKAADLETGAPQRKLVLRRALEFIPNSIRIWKAAIEMEEDEDDARLMLSRAVECVPTAVELWLALARLEKYDKAKQVLNTARRFCPGSHEIWIAAGKLEETNNQINRVEMIIQRGVDEVNRAGNALKREDWIKEAEDCEKAGSIATCQAIIRATVGTGVDEEARKSTWMEDAEACKNNGNFQTARAIYAFALKVFPSKKSIWLKAAFLEKEHGTRETLEELLQRAVKYCPQAEVLWLMGAKEKWRSGDVNGARIILSEAFNANPNSEQIWLAAVKLESECGEHDRARTLLRKAREKAPTPRVWMKAAILERQLNNLNESLELVCQGLEKYPTSEKLWMMKGQLEEAIGKIPEARASLSKGCQQCTNCIPLWILSAKLEEKCVGALRARSILEMARIKNPKNPLLWVEAIRMEMRNSNEKIAQALMAKALQECPQSGILWAESIFMEPRARRKARSLDAVKALPEDAHVVCAVARLLVQQQKKPASRSREWFLRATRLDPDWGDHWARWYAFEVALEEPDETPEHRQDRIRLVVNKCKETEPRHGDAWPRIAKDVKNNGASVETILQLCAAELEP